MSDKFSTFDDFASYCKEKYLFCDRLPALECSDLGRYIYSCNDPYFCVYQSNGDFLASSGIHIAYSEGKFIVHSTHGNWNNIVSPGEQLVAVEGKTVEKGLLDKCNRSVEITVWSAQQQRLNRIRISDFCEVTESVFSNRLFRIDNILYVDMYSFSLSTLLQIDKNINDVERIIFDLTGFLGGDIKRMMTYLTYFSYKDRPAKLIFENAKMEQIEYLNHNPSRSNRAVPYIDFVINRRTASAPELFCSAIRELYPGTVYGENSYGKNIVQKRVYYNEHIVLVPVYRFIPPKKTFIDVAVYSGTSIVPDENTNCMDIKRLLFKE